MSDDEAEQPKLSREEEAELRKEKNKQDLEEYEAMRREEREKEEEEIRQLRERREQRKKEREEEEKKMAEQRAVEEQRRRAEEEERQKKKREEEARRREAREEKNKEMQKKHESDNKPNFVIHKKSHGSSEEEAGPAKEVKSKEQLEAERKAILSQRIQPLAIDGFSGDKLREKAKELFDHIYKLESEKYDLEQTFKQQAYDMADLAERARQMNKGGKGSKAAAQAEPDPMAAKIGGIPPKLVMYSQYERVKDHRSFDDRQGLFKGPMYGEEFVRIEPKVKLALGPGGYEVVGEYEAPAPKSESAPAPAPAAAPEPEPEPPAAEEPAGEEVTVEE